MNYNLNNLDIDSNLNVNIETPEIVIPKKNYYCCNCNRKGHTYKICNEPIISNGIIGIYITNFNKTLLPLLENYLIENYRLIKNNNVILDKNINNDIKFLMVQRKNSLGYLEFIRGRYNLQNTTTLINLLQQMTPEEIDDIINKDFDYLWNSLWDINNIKNKNHYKEYVNSKYKFYELKMNNIDLIKTIKTNFNFNEWGFPKGRRELYESDLICAIREFEEETTIKENNYLLFEDCKPIRENLVGTNGINYAHNYFLALLHENNDNFDINNREIGNMKIMNINECTKLIRPYHVNKIKIIKNIYNIINNFIKEYENIEI